MTRLGGEIPKDKPALGGLKAIIIAIGAIGILLVVMVSAASVYLLSGGQPPAPTATTTSTVATSTTTTSTTSTSTTSTTSTSTTSTTATSTTISTTTSTTQPPSCGGLNQKPCEGSTCSSGLNLAPSGRCQPPKANGKPCPGGIYSGWLDTWA